MRIVDGEADVVLQHSAGSWSLESRAEAEAGRDCPFRNIETQEQ